MGASVDTLFLPMRGYEQCPPRNSSQDGPLFLPMRGYEFLQAPICQQGLIVISPHEGL